MKRNSKGQIIEAIVFHAKKLGLHQVTGKGESLKDLK